MEYRRRWDMIQTYNIFKDIDRINSTNCFTQAKYKGTRSYSMELFKSQFEAELRKQHLVKGLQMTGIH